MKKALQVILHILGFPLLIAAVVLVNLPIIQDGISYGIYVFVGIIVAAVMAIIYYIAFIIVTKSKKKSIRKQTMTLVILVFVILCGLWIVLDFALPDFLADATSNTVFYEDLVDNYQARAVVNSELLKEYIRRNYENGNLPDEDNGGYTLEEYQKQGVKNENVAKLLAIHFKSIDKAGYASFVDPWIGMANDGRLTITTLVHLLTDEREYDREIPYALYDKELDELVEDPVYWNVLDMMGSDMEIAIDLDGLLPDTIGKALQLFGGVQGVVEQFSPNLAAVVEEVLGSPIYVSYDGQAIKLTPSNEMRGVLGYQNMAWLNSNGLLYAVLCLMSVRNIFLVLGAWIILVNFMIGMLRGMGKQDKKELEKVQNEGKSGHGSSTHPVVMKPGDYIPIDLNKMRYYRR